MSGKIAITLECLRIYVQIIRKRNMLDICESYRYLLNIEFLLIGRRAEVVIGICGEEVSGDDLWMVFS